MTGLNETHDPARRSWVESANVLGCEFPIQNLPFGAFQIGEGKVRIGVAIGDSILDLTTLESLGVLRPSEKAAVFADGALNSFMELGVAAWRKTRRAIGDLLDKDNPHLRDDTDLRDRVLVPMAEARLCLPFFVRSFTDFYASKEHATNVGRMIRGPDNALMPNWLHLPVGYNGRASTVVVSGTPIVRPLGQLKPPDSDTPRLGASERLDFELELGAIVGGANPPGQPITTAQADAMIFGYVLLNDWSARDIQTWEYQPLGPFQAKAFATTISPWVVTAEALEPFRVAPPEPARPLLPYLTGQRVDALDIELEAAVAPPGAPPHTVCRTNARHLYYTISQQLAHHALCGCAMVPGDLLGSGTISGPSPESLGSLLELSHNGKTPIQVGEVQRVFLEDGDSVVLSGRARGDGVTIGFGTCEGTVMPAPSMPNWGAPA